jgi:hypothetical protein
MSSGSAPAVPPFCWHAASVSAAATARTVIPTRDQTVRDILIPSLLADPGRSERN